MRRLVWMLSILVVAAVVIPEKISAAGISVDAGLTPAEGRWILRTQLRYVHRDDDPTPMDRSMKVYMFNNTLAYGLRRDLTLMVKQALVRHEMVMAGATSRDTGLSDLFVMAKYRVYRMNTPEQTFGLAATLGLGLPTGGEAITSDTWDVKAGVYTSWRRGSWASDFNLAHAWLGPASDGSHGGGPGDEISLDWALAHQFSVGETADVSLTPVVEFSYKHIFPDRLESQSVPDTGEAVIHLSPGIKFTRSSFILEVLAQIPVWQELEGSQLKRDTGMLVGTRFMF